MVNSKNIYDEVKKSIMSTNGHDRDTNSSTINHNDGYDVNDMKMLKNEHTAGDLDIYCGIGSCRPAFAQGCKSMAWFTLTYSLTGIVTSALNIYINSQITTLEKHFNISSSVSGFLMSCNDLGYLSTTLFMSFYTRRAHVPRALSFSTVIYGLSGLFCTIAFFGSRNEIPSPPKDSDNMNTYTTVSFTQVCQNVTASANASCEDISSRAKTSFQISDTWRTVAICVLAVGMILQGMAKSPRQSFIGTYVDDNVPKTKTTLYLGIMTGMSIFGPAIAFALGGVFSSMYVTLEETNLSPRDPRWLGAWWLGFLVFGGSGLIVAVPLMFFPKRMRRQYELEAIEERKKKNHKGKSRFWSDFKDFLHSMFRLFLNPVYACLTVATGVNMMGISGMMAFMPKYLESQFTITAAQANIMLGLLNVLSASLGTILGGFLTSRFKLSPLSCLKMMITFMVLSTAFMSFGFFVGCDQPIIHKGLEAGESSGGEVISQCVQGCNCDGENFFPVCGSDNRNYFSPCHAGCTSMDQSTFTNCSCLATNGTRTATAGICIPDCDKLYVYMPMAFLGAFITTIIMMPGFIASVRSVKEEDKPLAIGFGAFAGTLIGWFPGPVIFGQMVDTTCILWKTTCSSVGACSLYDISLFRFRMHIMLVGLRIITASLYVAALLFALYSKKTVFQPHIDEVIIVKKVKEQDRDADETDADAAFIMLDNPNVRETYIN